MGLKFGLGIDLDHIKGQGHHAENVILEFLMGSPVQIHVMMYDDILCHGTMSWRHLTLLGKNTDNEHTVAPLLSPVQEVSSSISEITIEMHMHDGTEVCHFVLSPM